jgi:hypothetical protein
MGGYYTYIDLKAVLAKAGVAYPVAETLPDENERAASNADDGSASPEALPPLSTAHAELVCMEPPPPEEPSPEAASDTAPEVCERNVEALKDSW